MPRNFSSLLRKMRQDRGFHSAYAFYHDNGGRRVFPFTFTYYARIEKGSALPRPAWLPILLTALRSPSAAGSQGDFIASYLRDVFGDDSLFDDLVVPWLKPAHALPLPKKALRSLMGRLSRNLTHEESAAIVSSPAAFWSFFCLTKSSRPMTTNELTKATCLPAKQVTTGLKALCTRKLVKRLPDGGFWSPLWKNYSVFPHHGREQDAFTRKVDEYVARAVGKGGARLMSRRAIIRAEEGDMLGVTQALYETVEHAQGCAVEDPGHRTALYMVETKLQRIFPF